MWDEGDRSFLLPIDEGLSEIPALTVKEKAVATIKNGLPLSPSGIAVGSAPAICRNLSASTGRMARFWPWASFRNN